jgi:tRNA-binding protein
MQTVLIGANFYCWYQKSTKLNSYWCFLYHFNMLIFADLANFLDLFAISMDRHPISGTIRFADFEKVDLRAGTIIRAEPFPEARKAAYKLWVDLGPLGIKKSSAQITVHYQPDTLIGKQVLCVVNFESRQIANFISEVLVTGFADAKNDVVLCAVDKSVPNGARLF